MISSPLRSRFPHPADGKRMGLFSTPALAGSCASRAVTSIQYIIRGKTGYTHSLSPSTSGPRHVVGGELVLNF